MDAEVGAVHARQVEQVADEPAEPLRLGGDRRGRVLRRRPRPRAAPRRSRAIAVSGVFSSWLTESRNERSASRARASCSARSLNETASVASSAAPSTGHRVRMRARRRGSRGRRDARRRAGRSGARATNAAAAASAPPTSAAITIASTNGVQRVVVEALRPEQDERAVADRLGREVVVGPVDRDAAGRDLARRRARRCAAAREHGRVEQVALVLALRGTGCSSGRWVSGESAFRSSPTISAA